MAAKGGDSRQGLIVSLVFAVLLVIGLGVAAYYGYAGQEDMAKDVLKANNAKKAIEKDRDWHKFLALQYKAYLGVASPQDKADLSVLRGRYESETVGKGESNYAENKAAVEKLDRVDKYGWHKGENRPLKTADEEIGRLHAEMAELRKTLDAAKAEAKQHKDAKLQAEEFAANAAADYKKSLAKLQGDFIALQNQKQKDFLDLRAAYEAENKRVEDVQKKAAADIEEREKANVKLEAERRDLELREARGRREKTELETEMRRLRGQVDPVNPLESGPARGKIVRLDRSGGVAWINLGSADNLRPQVRFSVFRDKGDGTPTGELKASLQVTEVAGDHLAKAQVTYVRDANRAPLLPGDLLYNPTWSPTAREHVAVAGIIDLTGLSNDNTAEFIRSLERQGVTVDAYLDLKELAVKGKGMTSQTSYLIVGDRPDLGTQILGLEGARADAVKNVNDKITQMTDEAAKLGVQVIPFRRYLVLTGHRAPRGVAEAAAPGSLARPVPVKKEAEKPEKKEVEKPEKPEKPEKKPGPKDNGK